MRTRMSTRLSAQKRLWLLQKAKEEELDYETKEIRNEERNRRCDESEVQWTDAGSTSEYRNILAESSGNR